MNVHSSYKWWSTLKSEVIGSSSSLPPLVSDGGRILCESVGKADLLSDPFDSKQSRETVDLTLTCHPSPSLTTFSFRLSEVRRLLLNLDLYDGTDPFGMFPVFFTKTADLMAPVFVQCFGGFFVSVVFRHSRDRPMSPQFFRKVHRPPLLPSTDRLP